MNCLVNAVTSKRSSLVWTGIHGLLQAFALLSMYERRDRIKWWQPFIVSILILNVNVIEDYMYFLVTDTIQEQMLGMLCDT